MQPLRQLRVFICSPSDVADERGSAIRVIDQLQYDPLIRDQITLESAAWDKPGAETPLSARMTPQEAINQGLPKPSDCDIVVVILWARMGTPLPDNFRRSDGSRYLSGTEWEFEDALQGSQKSDPEILVYRCIKKVLGDYDDPDYEEKKTQYERVKAFFKTFYNPDGTIKRGYNDYETPEDFRCILEQHLKKTLKRLIENLPLLSTLSPIAPGEVVKLAPKWKGSPFPGLRAFTLEDSPIFFGRGRETDELVNKLQDSDCRMLMVLGDSGSGKSSLIGAGLLARLKENAVPGSKDWPTLRFTPGDPGEDPFQGLTIKLAPMLRDHPWQASGILARELITNPGKIKEVAEMALASAPHWAELLLFIDQFEELFTTTKENFRGPFIQMLKEASSVKNIRIVASLRVDMYAECAEWPHLVELIQTGSYLLAPPGAGALYEMITRPANRAGLLFEEGLAQRIVDDAGANPGALALLAYALDELYHACKNDKHLTHKAYEGLGKLQGAIGKRAELSFENLDKAAQETLPKVFHELVLLDIRGNASRCRADLGNIRRTETMARVVDALAGDRLLVKSGSENDRSTVEVAHEALFRVWPRFKRWIIENKEFLIWRQQLQSSLYDWERTERDEGILLRGVRLKEAERWLNDQGGDLTQLEKDFIQLSSNVKEEKARLRSRLIPERVEGNFKTGVTKKLVLSMLLVGALPLIIGLLLAFYQGTQEIREVNGSSFEALAIETARKLDLVMADELARTALLTTDVKIIERLERTRDALSELSPQDLALTLKKEQEAWNAKDADILQRILKGPFAEILQQHVGETFMDPGHPIPVITRSATRGLFITDRAGRVVASLDSDIPYLHQEEPWWKGAFQNGIGQPYIGTIGFNQQLKTYTFTLAVPIIDSLRYEAIGVLQRIYDAKEFFAPSIDIIRFGKTGHAMLIDSRGVVLSCPILPTGTSIADTRLIPLVTPLHAGWTPAPSDGHGGTAASIIGFAPLSNTNQITQPSTGQTWHMFVWQSSGEVFAPIEHFFKWTAAFGLLGVALLVALGYIAASRITSPIRRLQEAARLIGQQKLKAPISIMTGDEFEDLAVELDSMNAQIEITLAELESQIELKNRQVEKIQTSTTYTPR